MRKCIEDFQIPCRWVPDLGFGNGYPLFNYYSVFPYYIGGIASYFLGFIGSAKLLFFIAAALAGISMFLFARGLFGTYPALTSATLYMFAPYRALDIYVRGAVAESFSIAIIPLVFYFAFKLTKEDLPRFKIGFALSFAAFLTSHNIMVVLFFPVISTLLLVWFWKRDSTKVWSLIMSMLLGFGLSAFFTIPAFLEKNLVQIDNLVRLEMDFRAHFVSLYQLFLDREWGYGASFPGTADTISFQIGWPHWFLVIGSIFSLLFVKNWGRRLLIFYCALLLIFGGSLFMTHILSVFIWEQIGMLRFAQFPWRFLALAIFSASLLGGFLLYNFKRPLKQVTAVALIFAAVVFNWGYFKPQEFYLNLIDQEKLSGLMWETQQRAAILDYLPSQSVEPLETAPDMPIIVEGEAKIKNFKNRSNKWTFEAEVKKDAKIEVPVFDFPNWQVFVNDRQIKHSDKNYLGRISFTLNPGNYLVLGKFENTLIRTIANVISFVSILVIIFILYGKIRKTTS